MGWALDPGTGFCPTVGFRVWPNNLEASMRETNKHNERNREAEREKDKREREREREEEREREREREREERENREREREREMRYRGGTQGQTSPKPNCSLEF